MQFVNKEAMLQWLDEFPDRAMAQWGIGDLSIVHDLDRIKLQNPKRRVYIWSLDRHLGAYA